ncbi:MAG: hypothetical protein WCD89_18315 [Anaerocolumna sp.]
MKELELTGENSAVNHGDIEALMKESEKEYYQTCSSIEVHFAEESIKERLYHLGADMCGIAGLDRFSEAPEGYHPSDVLPTCKSVIVFVNRFLTGTLACRTAVPYTVVRNILSDKMDKMAVQFCIDLEKEGILAIPARTNGSEWDENTGRFRSIVSAKHAAQAAGLGTIGRHSLLITPEYGSMVWLSQLDQLLQITVIML